MSHVIGDLLAVYIPSNLGIWSTSYATIESEICYLLVSYVNIANVIHQKRYLGVKGKLERNLKTEKLEAYRVILPSVASLSVMVRTKFGGRTLLESVDSMVDSTC